MIICESRCRVERGDKDGRVVVVVVVCIVLCFFPSLLLIKPSVSSLSNTLNQQPKQKH